MPPMTSWRSLFVAASLAFGLSGTIFGVGCGTGQSQHTDDDSITVAGAPPAPVRMIGVTKYHEFFDDVTPDGRVIIESDPPGATVLLVRGLDEYGAIGDTPCVFYCKASGVPYSFKLVKDGYLDTRIEARPMPNNPAVRRVIRLRPDFLSAASPVRQPEPPASYYATAPEERNLRLHQTGIQIFGTPEARGTATHTRSENDQVAPTGSR